MPFIIAGVLAAIVGLLRGGRPSNLGNLSIRWSALPLLALGTQIFVLYGPYSDSARSFSLAALLILASYGLLLITVLVNRRMPGMVWLGLGATLNFVVILANGGWMPITAELLTRAGFIETPSAIALGQRVWATKDVVMVGHDIRLRWLSDVFVIPRAGLLTAVFSIGDVLMMFGLFLLIQSGMRCQSEQTR